MKLYEICIKLLLASDNYLNDSDFFVAVFCNTYCFAVDNALYLPKKI